MTARLLRGSEARRVRRWPSLGGAATGSRRAAGDALRARCWSVAGTCVDRLVMPIGAC